MQATKNVKGANPCFRRRYKSRDDRKKDKQAITGRAIAPNVKATKPNAGIDSKIIVSVPRAVALKVVFPISEIMVRPCNAASSGKQTQFAQSLLPGLVMCLSLADKNLLVYASG